METLRNKRKLSKQEIEQLLFGTDSERDDESSSESSYFDSDVTDVEKSQDSDFYFSLYTCSV